MKQETFMTRLTMLLLFLGLVAYFGIYTYNSLSDPFSSVLCYTRRVDEAVEVTGYVIREELVLPEQNGVVDILPEEGEKVAAGETVATIYKDASALDQKLEIRQLELELEQLEYSLRQDSGNGDVARLDQDIITAMVDLRADTATGDLSRLEENAMQLKSMVFHRNYTYNNNAESVESITAMIKTVSSELQKLKKQTASAAKNVRATASGVYSGQVDGYETVLTVEGLANMTVSDLEGAAPLPVNEDGQAGKLITSSKWYFAAPLSQEEAKELKAGDKIALRFSREDVGEIPAKVERVSEPENGRVLVVLSSDRQLSEVTLLRRQTAELILESTTGIRVPKSAIRVEEKTSTDEETGEEVITQQTVVYAVVGMQAERKPVVILAEEEDHFLVEPLPVENAQNTTALKKSLRSGDEVIVTAKDLYDGKVVK